MSLPKIGGTLVLDNEAQFKRALAEVNAGLKVNRSEMRLVAEQSKSAGDAQKALQAKMDALSGAINSQKEKVAILEQALAKSVQRTGESSKQTMSWQVSLNDARRDLIKMESEMQEYQKEQQESQKETSDFREELKKMGKEMGENMPQSAEKGKKGLGNITTALVGVGEAAKEVVSRIMDLSSGVGQSAENIKNNSQTMGMSMTEYQEWDYIFQSVGYSAEQAGGDFAALAEKAKDAAEGTGEGKEVFDALGISVKKAGGQIKSQNELFAEVVTKLQRMSDETRRNAYASQLLGTTGEELVPVLNMTAGQLEELRAKAHETGSVMSNETVDGFVKMNQANRDMRKNLEIAQTQIASQLMPVLTSVFELMSAIPTPVMATVGTLAALIPVAFQVATAMGTLAIANKVLAGSNTAIGTSSMFAGLGLNKLVLGILAVVAVIALLVGTWTYFSGKASEAGNAAAQAQGGLKNIQRSVPKYALGTRNAKQGAAIVGENGPEIVQMQGGERVYTARQTRRMLGGGTYVDRRSYQYIFKVDDIDTYQRIVEREKRRQMQIRQGFVGV